MKEILEIPESAKLVINEYNTLPIGEKAVKVPYFMNIKKRRAGLRVLVGKGDPGEIVREVYVTSQVKGFDLNKASIDQIRKFMIDSNIGIDCSAFIVHIYNSWLRSENKSPLINYLRFPKNDFVQKLKRFLRPVENIGANLLTGDLNAKKITKVNDIVPGDLIRSKGRHKNSHHVLLIIRVMKEDNQVREIDYIHSTKEYGSENGIRQGKIIVTDTNKALKDQEWQEIQNIRNWTHEGFLRENEDNGVRRIEKLSLEYLTSTV